VISQKNGIFNLSTKNTTYLFALRKSGHLEHLYYGPYIKDKSIELEALECKAIFPMGISTLYNEDTNNLNFNILKTEISTPGKGDYRTPSTVISYNGGMTTLDFIYKRHQIINGKPTSFELPASYATPTTCQTLQITMKDKELPIRLVLSYSVFENSDVISRKTTVYNDSQSVITIQSLASMQIDLDDNDYDLITFDGAWARERHITRRPLSVGTIVNDTRMGVSSASHNPCIYLARKDCTEISGECIATNLVYSGNHKESIEVNDFNQTRILTGINDQTFNWSLQSGDSFETPEAISTYSLQGLSGASRNLHYFVNNHIVRGYWKNRPRPILVNNWEATYFDFNSAKLLKLAGKAKEVGAELFVLDDGWFGNRNDDQSSLGDWSVNTQKLRGGLGQLSSKIHNMGMMFGLWVEPEMISRNSNLFDKHPDWAIMIPGREPSVGRHQFILDLTNPEVRDYLEEELTKIFQLSRVDYVKWDMNRVFSDIHSSLANTYNYGEFYHRYILGLYEILTKLRDTFPKILFESCASGGNRFDLGMLCYMPQTWTSDCTDAYERVLIQEGTSCGYPLSAMGCHVSTAPNHQTLRKTDIETRFNVACFGNLGYELDLTKIHQSQLDIITEQIGFYKQYRETLQFGTFVRLETMSSTNKRARWVVMNKDKSELLVLDYKEKAQANPPFEKLKVEVANPNYHYELFNRPQRIDISMFGDMINNMAPLNIKEGSKSEEIANKLLHLNCEITHHRIGGDLLMYAGINLNQEFGGLGYNQIQSRALGDNGSRIYVIKRFIEND
jgi:alpha-galactosidase